MTTFFFLHTSTGRSWPTDDPHQWLLEHRDDDLLAAARERLALSSDDPGRCLRAAIRRCNLALVRVVNESQIVVEHWSDPPPDLRLWAKENGWGKPGVAVSFSNVKAGSVVVHEDGRDILLYGVRVGPRFPWGEYTERYEQRMIEEADDQDAAPASATNFVWENCPDERRLTWRVLKGVWKAERVECPNCDVTLVLAAFEWRIGMLSFRSGRSSRVCSQCRRRFEAAEPEPLAWVASVLPPELRPTHLRLWDTVPINWPRMSLAHHRPVQFVDREG